MQSVPSGKGSAQVDVCPALPPIAPSSPEGPIGFRGNLKLQVEKSLRSSSPVGKPEQKQTFQPELL